MNLTYTARHFAADNKTAVPVIYDAVADNNLFGRYATAATIFVFTRFNTDGIIANIETAVVNLSNLARF